MATISVSWPSFRYGRGEECEKIAKVKEAAARISAVLGYSPDF
jgi:DNA-binding IclR family transcriptional regulator